MSRPIAHAIDFGTTNSRIAAVYADRIEVAEFAVNDLLGAEKVPYIPSFNYLHRNGNRDVGMSAVRQYLMTGANITTCAECPLVERHTGYSDSACRWYPASGECFDSRLMYGLKADLADPTFTTTHSWGIDFSLPDLIAVLLGGLSRYAQVPDADLAILSHPVVFEGSEGDDFIKRNELAIDRLVSAASSRGYSKIKTISEPEAVAFGEDFDARYLMAVDFGGGTFDVAIINFSSGAPEVVALEGAAVGGEYFSALLFAAKVAPQIGLTSVSLPTYMIKALGTLGGAMSLINKYSPDRFTDCFGGSLGNLARESIYAILYGGQAYEFYRSIEAAKLDLSEREATSIEFRRDGLEVSAPVTRYEFTALISGAIDQVFGCIDRALDKAGISPAQIDAVVRTGGSSLIPAFAERLVAMFGDHKIIERSETSAVVYGMGVLAQEELANE